MDPVPAPKDVDHSIATALQAVITDEVRFTVAKALATILDIVEEAVQKLFLAAGINLQEGIHTVPYDTVQGNV